MRWTAELLLAATLLVVACGEAAKPAAPRQTPNPVAMGPPAYQTLWVDAFRGGIHSRQEIDQLVATAERGNVNALFVQVRKAGDAYYLNSLEPVAWDIFAPPTFDPLRYLVQRAHAATPRIEVHAWVNTFYVGTRSGVYWEHGAEWGNRTADGRTRGYLDPGSAAARDYTRRVLMHLARAYDVDGLHLDFIRYPEGGDWGYSPAAVRAYDSARGRTGDPDPGDPDWKQWRRDQVTTFVRDLARDLRAQRPRVALSASLIAWGSPPGADADWQRTAAYDEVYQDWDRWLREGLLDLAVPMNYDSAWSPRAARWFDQWTEWEKDHQYDRRVVIGVGAFLNYPEDTLAQLRRALAPSARGNRAAGVAIYSYASTSLYGTNDYYANPDAAAVLPRQPYAAGLDATGLRERAQRFNDAFWSLLSGPGSYADPVVGPVPTEPAFPRPAPTPRLPWKRG